MRIHHVGYLVKKLDKALKAFLDLGYSIRQDIVFDEYRQVNICFLEKDGYVVELVSPASKESVVSELMKKIGNSPYHICYETDSFDDDVEKLLDLKYVLCSEKHGAVAIDGKNVCFLVHPYLGMIELLEV
jgi:methylmalonyl-CoA/ethylmalonyl-CoA epimerase